MQKTKLIKNDRNKELRICIEPLADEVLLKPGSSVKFFAEVIDELYEFETEDDGDGITVYLPANFGKVLVSIDGGEFIEM